MSMEKHKCKLCSRKFTSGKAMGGHMRSHLRVLPLPPKTPPQKQDSGGGGGRSESTLVSEEEEEEEEEKHLGYGLRENPKKSSKIVDPEFLDAGSVVHEMDQSETESNSKKPTKRRSKRTRRMFVSDEDDTDGPHPKVNKSADFEPVSSFSDSSPEEDIAVCLMMLSKDVWRNEEYSRFKDHKQVKYQCEICHKVLKSSQALGSHKTIHKKNNNTSSINEDQNKGKKSSLSRQLRSKDEDQKVHECPYCGKIFGSGQALGGHKRSHILLSSSITASSSSKVGDSLMDSSSVKFPYGFIDLNMPAPVEDEDFSIS